MPAPAKWYAMIPALKSFVLNVSAVICVIFFATFLSIFLILTCIARPATVIRYMPKLVSPRALNALERNKCAAANAFISVHSLERLKRTGDVV